MIADGNLMPLASIGYVYISHLSLSNIYCISRLAMNLMSVSQLCDSSYSVHFSSTFFRVQNPQSQRLTGLGCTQGGLYVMDKWTAISSKS